MSNEATPKNSSLEALAATGLSYEAIQKVSETLLTTPTKDDRVCICGHTMSKHKTTSSGLISCVPSRHRCPCKRMHAVLKSDNIRPFMRKTSGHGEQHALMLGMVKSIEVGATVSWINTPLTCERCGEEKAGRSGVAEERQGVAGDKINDGEHSQRRHRGDEKQKAPAQQSEEPSFPHLARRQQDVLARRHRMISEEQTRLQVSISYREPGQNRSLR